MRQDKQLDELFRKGFKPNFSEEIPEDFLSDVNKRLDQLEKTKKKKRQVAIWWVSGILSLIGVFIFEYSLSSKENVGQTPNSTKISASQTNANSLGNAQNPSGKNLRDENNLAPYINTESTGGNKAESHAKWTNVTGKAPSKQTGFNVHIQSENNENQKVEQNESTNLASIDNRTKEDLENLNSDEKNDLAITEIIQPEKPSDSSNIEIVSTYENTDSTNQLVTNQNAIPENKSREKKERTLTYHFGFYSGVSGIFHKALTPNNPISIGVVMPYTASEYRDKRRLEESMLTSWDMSVRFGLQYKQWTFSSGIDYFNWGERTDYSNVSYNAQFKNMYRFVNIPILFGYQFQKGSYGIQPLCGFSVGFLAKEVSGYYLNRENTTSSFQANINKLTGTLHAGLDFSYFSLSGVKISLSPIFRQALGKIVQSDIVRNRYSSLGMQLGIGYCWK
jgi:hypothetical protein